MILSVNMKDTSYDVIIERGSLKKINSYLTIDPSSNVLIVSDTGVPQEYKDIIKKQFLKCYVYNIEQGELSKNFTNYGLILDYLVQNEFSRTDTIIALGGGVVGDLAGFVAATYMRGINFYNIPTTLLSQIDSSIGGKTAIDKCGIKNIVGAFYQPKKVLIDPNVLNTLDERQLHSGLVEAIKMGLTSDESLFELISESKDLLSDIELIISKALMVKKDVVEKDPHEKHLRKILNFGHTIGHAIESRMFDKLLHGECVGLGMLYFSSDEVKNKLINVLNKYNLPTVSHIDKDELYEIITHDKKRKGKLITIICVDTVGSYEIKDIEIEKIKEYL